MSDPSALLVIDIGTLFTHVALLDDVAGEYRVVARAEALSTLEPPDADAWLGVLAAIRELERISARQLAREDTPLQPQRPDGTGVDAVVIVSSAAGVLPVVIAAISSKTVGESLRRVARSSYTTVLGSVTLDMADERESDLVEGESWIDYQLTKLARLPAATVLIGGGIEGGNAAPLDRLAHMLAFTVLRREQSSGREYAHVLFAGNSAAMPGIEAALSTIAPITTTENVRPSLEQEQLVPARMELARLYNDRVLPMLPGMSRLRAMANAPLHATVEGYYPLVRFISQFHQRNVLFVDIGAMSTACYTSDGQAVQMAVETNCGTAYGAGGVLDRVGPAALTRWLPFEMSDQQIREHILNRLLRPQIVPLSREEVFIEQAVAREALQSTMSGLNHEQIQLSYDLIIASGGVVSHVVHPAESLLLLLDVVQLDRTNSLLMTDIYLDWDGLAPLCAGLLWQYPDAAFCIWENDVLRHGPLANCIVLNGNGKPGELALEAELTPVGGPPVSIQVLHGEVRRLPLAPGRRGTLRLRPARGVRIGGNEAGAEVQSDIAAIHGSTLGIIIDARGRPLPVADPAVRRAQIWSWLAQLGAVPNNNPYQPLTNQYAQPAPSSMPASAETQAPEDLPTREAPAIPDWLRSDLETEGLVQPPPEDFGVEALPPWLAEDAPIAQDTVADLGERPAGTEAHDFSSLRAELNTDKPKRGLFGRKK
jgi:hypothetical protein